MGFTVTRKQPGSFSLSFFFVGGQGETFRLKKCVFDKGSKAIYLFVCIPGISSYFIFGGKQEEMVNTTLPFI